MSALAIPEEILLRHLSMVSPFLPVKDPPSESALDHPDQEGVRLVAESLRLESIYFVIGLTFLLDLFLILGEQCNQDQDDESHFGNGIPGAN